MKAGKFILGLAAFEAIAQLAPDPGECKVLLASIAIAEGNKQSQELGVACGSTYRARFVEDMPFLQGEGTKTGYLLEYKVGPNPPVDDDSKYKYLKYFAAVGADGKIEQIYQIEGTT